MDFLALACRLTHRSPLPESLCNPHFSVIEWKSQVPITGEKRSLVAIFMSFSDDHTHFGLANLGPALGHTLGRHKMRLDNYVMAGFISLCLTPFFII